MLPFGHMAVGYVFYVAYAVSVTRRLPTRAATAAVLVGSQFPDLVDKPLAFVGVLPSGRSLAHSLLFAAALTALGWYVVRVTGRETTTVAFLVGHLSHLPADGYRALAAGHWDGVGYLFWPAVPASRYALDDTAPWERVVDIAATPQVLLQAALAAGAVGLWYWLRRRRRSRHQ